MLGPEPLGQRLCFGTDTGFGIAALPPVAPLLFDKVHGRWTTWRASPVIQRSGKRPTTGYVRLKNHQAQPPRTTPVFQGIVKASPPMFIVEIGT